VAWLLHGGHLKAEQVIWRFAEGRLDFVPACRAGSVARFADAAINPSAGEQSAEPVLHPRQPSVPANQKDPPAPPVQERP
jgi:hypothetical protein